MKAFCDALKAERMENMNAEYRESGAINNEEFSHCVRLIQDHILKNKIAPELLFELFGLQKQGETGNCTMDKPWFYEPEKKG
jgi:hypothetical protein